LGKKYLLDVNALIALTDAEHVHYQAAMNWFDREGYESWGICPVTEAGFVRVTINPVMKARTRTLGQAIAILQSLKGHPGCKNWEIDASWVDLTAPFAARIGGYQQVADALLLGLAIKQGGILVTFDRGLKYMAGDKFSRNLLILE
jgi:uncharacterized protein